MNKVYIVVILFSIAQSANSQDTLRPSLSGEEVIESIIDNSSDEQDTQTLGEELEYFRDHPVNIAKPNYGELVKIPFVSPLLAESIILYTDTVSITNIEQLRLVSLMTPKLFEQLLPFITIESSAQNYFALNFSPLQLDSRTRLERRLQTTKGFSNNKFLGDANGSYQRLRISNTNSEIAFIAEKDAGELYNDGLLGGYLTVKNISLLKNATIGNFTISAGQGLVFSKNISVSKGSNSIGQVKKNGRVISPTVSTDEYRYFQGTALQFFVNNIMLTAFYSARKLPASIDDNGIVTSFYTSGIYRTESDLQRRNLVAEKTLGGKIDFSFDPAKTVSVNLMNVEYGHDLKPTLFNLEGKRSLSAGSVSWEIPFAGIIPFGEIATNDGERFSKTAGTIFAVSKQFAVSYHHRAYSKGYTSPFSRPFGERDNIGDGELGNYLGLEIKEKNITVNSYIDQFYLPSTTNGFGVNGREFLLFIQNSVTNRLEFTFQIRNKYKSQSEIHNADDERIQTNYRASYKFKVSSRFSLSQRFEFVKVSYNPSQYAEEGFLTFVEGVFKHPKKGISLKSRIIFFDTRSYDSRLYQYESDVAGNFSNPPIYGKGIRWYVVAGHEVFNDFALSFKYSETKKLNEVVLGSGDDEIQGNLDNQIALQLDFSF